MAASGRTPSEPSRQSRVDRDDDELLDALRRGNERVFTALVECWSGVMLRLALSHLDNRAVAEKIVQDAWLTVVRSLVAVRTPISLRTRVLGIVVNLARSRGAAVDPGALRSGWSGGRLDALSAREPSSLATPPGHGAVAVADT
jgi:hypothetical protein